MKVKVLVLTSGIVCVALFVRPIQPTAQEQRQPIEHAGSLDTGTPNPVPLINQPLVPDAVAPGGSEFTLTVNGTGFVAASVVNWNGSALATTFVSGSQLTATVPAADIAIASTASVTVVNPSPGGGTSNAVFFELTTSTTSVAFAGSEVTVGSSPFQPGTGDLNRDGKADLVIPNGSDYTVSLLLGNGDGTFQGQTTYAVGTKPWNVAIADFNADGKLDLAVANSSSSFVSVLLGNGDGTLQAAVNYATGEGPQAVAIGDFNGDGKLDLAVADQNCNPSCGPGFVSILLGNGDGTFQPQVEYSSAQGPNSVGIGDFNRDGKLDLAVAAGNGGGGTQVSVLLGNGDGTFGSPVNYSTGLNPDAVVAADFNKDGILDLAVLNNIGSVSILLGNGNGTFRTHVDYSTGSFPNGNLVVADLNGDGNLDLAMANGGSNNVSVLLGKGDGTFQPQLQFSTGPYPIGLAAGDFNQDGRLDLVAGNSGSNTASVVLQGTTVALSKAILSFPTQLVGSTSAAQTVTITNTGPISLMVSSVAITGTDPTDFGETNSCGSSVPPGGNCTVSVSFKPTAQGPRTGTLTITDNAANSPQTVALTGTGTVVRLSPAIVNFGDQKVGTTSPPQTVTVTNTGSSPLSIQGIGIGGTDFSDFAFTTTCGSSLGPKASCALNFTFTPTATGARRASAKLKDNGGGSPQTVRLQGTGT